MGSIMQKQRERYSTGDESNLNFDSRKISLSIELKSDVPQCKEEKNIYISRMVLISDDKHQGKKLPSLSFFPKMKTTLSTYPPLLKT